MLDVKVPGNTPEWLAQLGTAIVRPFASMWVGAPLPGPAALEPWVHDRGRSAINDRRNTGRGFAAPASAVAAAAAAGSAREHLRA